MPEDAEARLTVCSLRRFCILKRHTAHDPLTRRLSPGQVSLFFGKAEKPITLAPSDALKSLQTASSFLAAFGIMPATSHAQPAKRRAATARPEPAAAGAGGPLRPRDPTVAQDAGRNALKREPTKSSLSPAKSSPTAGSAKKVQIKEAFEDCDENVKPSKHAKIKKTTRAKPPPKMTASFVMGVQQANVRHPSRAKRRAEKEAAASTAHSSFLQAAQLAESSAVASQEAAKHAAKAVAEARQLAAKAAAALKGADSLPNEAPGKYAAKAKEKAANKAAKGPAKALKAAALVVAMRIALSEAAKLAAQTAEAQKQVQQFTAAWEAMLGKSWGDETLPVGHKLKQLCKDCGAAIADESFAVLVAKLGGLGSTVKFDKFLTVMVELGHAGVGLVLPQSLPGSSVGEGASKIDRGAHSAPGATGLDLANLDLANLAEARRLYGISSKPDGLGRALDRLRRQDGGSLAWLSFRDLVCFDPGIDSPDLAVEDATALTEDEARTLFQCCCGSSEGNVACTKFLEAVDSYNELSA
jgi:hypothetical protein